VASVLIVEDDGLIARHITRMLRDAGHTPVLASDGCTALREAGDRPDVVLLDLGLPDRPGEAALKELKSRPDTAQIPVLVITGKTEAARQLRESSKGWADILLKPVSGVQLSQAVNAALAGRQEVDADALRLAQERQLQLIQHLIVEGSDSLVFHTCRRLSWDRMRGTGSLSGDALTWTEIAERATREGLVDAGQASLLRCIPLTRPQRLWEGSA
jgi:DNA-binding response OmpR family regulator